MHAPKIEPPIHAANSRSMGAGAMMRGLKAVGMTASSSQCSLRVGGGARDAHTQSREMRGHTVASLVAGSQPWRHAPLLQALE